MDAPAPRTSGPTDSIGSKQEPDGGFETLYTTFFPRLVRYCRRAGNGDDAEEIAQETMARALEHLPRLDTSRSLWPWLKTIALNLVIDETRYQHRITPHQEGIDDGVADATEQAEERLILTAALRRLTPGQRAAVRLSYLEGRSPGEAAALLELSRPAFKQLLFRARRRLRSEYRRLSDTARGLVLAPLRWVRELWAGSTQRLAANGSISDAVGNLAGGLVAVAVILSAGSVAPDDTMGQGALRPAIQTEAPHSDPVLSMQQVAGPPGPAPATGGPGHPAADEEQDARPAPATGGPERSEPEGAPGDGADPKPDAPEPPGLTPPPAPPPPSDAAQTQTPDPGPDPDDLHEEQGPPVPENLVKVHLPGD